MNWQDLIIKDKEEKLKTRSMKKQFKRAKIEDALSIEGTMKNIKAIEILVEIQQARFDKHNNGDGLTMQEHSELIAINNLFELWD